VDTAPRFVVELLEFFGSTYLESQEFEHPPVRPPVARVIDPTVMTVVQVPLDIELTGSAHPSG
jgi:purine nucleosidase